MKQPTTPEEVKVLHDLLRSDPQRYLQIVSEWIAENPGNSHAYFDRHFAWMKRGEPARALADLDKVVELDPKPVAFGYGVRFIDISVSMRGHWRILVAPSRLIRRIGRKVSYLGCCTRLTVMPGWATRPPHWLAARVCATTFGLPASMELRAVAKSRSPKSCAAWLRRRAASAAESSSVPACGESTGVLWTSFTKNADAKHRLWPQIDRG